MDEEKKRGISLVLLAGLLWGVGSFISKVGVTAVGPWTAAYVRSLAFFPVVTGYILWKGELSLNWNQGTAYSMAAGLLTGATVILARQALQFYDVSLVNPVIRLNILVTLLLSVIVLKERINWKKGLGVAFALGALILLST